MITKDLNICLLPLAITWGDIDANLNTLKEAIQQVHPQTDLLIIPETFNSGFPASESKQEIREHIASRFQDTIEQLKHLASKFNLAICGSMVCEENTNLYNRAFFVEPNQDITFANKRHLFSMARENESFESGNKRMKIRYRGWNISMIICYDVRFPVWCRNVENEYDLLIACANWPEVRISAWNKLLEARAIENESYVCGVNCIGTDKNSIYYDGSSKVVDFKGNEIGRVAKNEDIVNTGNNQLIYATLSKSKLDNFRNKFPAHLDADHFSIL